jgi:uncharacterized membrane protein YeiH
MRDGELWFILIETIGLMSFAINAMIVAQQKDLSPFAVFIVACAAAFGGGTLRDILLGPAATPFFWVAYPLYVVLVFVATMAYVFADWFRSIIARRIDLIKNVLEIIALASLAGIGTAKAFTILAPGIERSWLGAAQLLLLSAFLGSATSAAGSVARDLLLNQFPSTFRRSAGILEPLIIGSSIIAVLLMAGVAKPWVLLIGFIVTVGLRSLTLWRPIPAPQGAA